MIALTLGLILLAPPFTAQDTLRLPELQEAAVLRDPRASQLALQESAAALRLRNVAVGRLPQLSASGEATYQSEVPGIPVNLPNMEISQPPKDRYAATLNVEQLLYDSGVMAGQRSVEQAQLGVARAEIAAALYPLRMEVNEAFFSAFLLQERSREVSILIEDLEARLKLIRAQVRAGAALPGDTAALRAELLRFDQERSELAANRRAALRVLGELTGRGISEAGVLVLPDLAALVASIQRDGEQSRAHPQYALFRAQRERLQREAGLTRARARPQVGAFSQLGYGRPGLKQFTDEFHEYWLAGIQLRWAPWNWGTTQREQEILQLQQRIVDMEEAAFAERLRRQVQDEIEAMQRLQAAIQTDEQIIALRAQVERQARTQLAERAITPAAYVDVRTDLQEARLAQQRHRVELAKARAQYLTTLGIPLQ